MNDVAKFIIWPGGYLAKKVIDHCLEESAETESNDSVREEEINRVINLIEQNRRMGVSEFEIEISHGFAKNISGKASAPIEGIPVDVACNINKDTSGKYLMKIVFLPETAAEKIRKIHDLYLEEIITEEQANNAKEELLKSI